MAHVIPSDEDSVLPVSPLQSRSSTRDETQMMITDSEFCSVGEKLRSDPECTEEKRGNEDEEEFKRAVTRCDKGDQEEDEETDESGVQLPRSDIEYPEGGLRGWLVVFGASRLDNALPAELVGTLM